MDSAERIIVEVEATGGVTVRPQDKVVQGQDLGLSPDFKGRVVAPVSGKVEWCAFRPDKHVFEICILPDEGRPEG